MFVPSRGKDYYDSNRRNRSTADDGDAAVAAIGVVRLERGRSLSDKDQGRRHCHLEHGQSLSHEDLGVCSSPVMAAAWHFPLPSPSPSPSPLPWLSLVCQLVVVSTPLPLVLSTLPTPQPLPINTLPPLVCLHLSSRLPLFAGW